MKPNRRKSPTLQYPFIFYICLVLATTFALLSMPTNPLSAAEVRVIGLGDSLTQGTMNATDNAVNTSHAYLQKTVQSLSAVLPLRFSQPLLGFRGQRLIPFLTPTNLGVDGSDIFSIEGIEYYKRVRAVASYISDDYLCNSSLPSQFQNNYDKVLFPLNRIAGKPVSQIDATLTLLNQQAAADNGSLALIFLWIGNNDSSLAALGMGGSNPAYLPIPLNAISAEITPALLTVLLSGQALKVLNFAPYTFDAIQRNLTETADFTYQLNHILERLEMESAMPQDHIVIMLMTLPYYSAVGYLFDSEDLEFYLQQVNPAYKVPPTFQRVAQDPYSGDRVSFFTFACMYALLQNGYSVENVNAILEKGGVQQDGLVMSQAEQHYIMSRIDSFNQAIKAASQTYGNVYLVDIGTYLNNSLGGIDPVSIGGRVLSRKWSRGGAFSLDGVHLSYTGQALIANYLIQEMNRIFQMNAPRIDLEQIMLKDPYIDRDGDGWVSGPGYHSSGLSELLFMFTDPDDTNSAAGVFLPADFWDRVSKILLQDLSGKPSVYQMLKLPANP